MEAKKRLKKNSPRDYAETLFLKTKKIFREFYLSRGDSPLAIINVNNLVFFTFFSALLEIFAKEKNTTFIEEIAKEYHQLLKKEFPGEIAYVKTAVALTSEEEAILSERLASVFGRYYRLEIEVKPELIGGLVVEIGDSVLDESVLGKIKELEQHLNLKNI